MLKRFPRVSILALFCFFPAIPLFSAEASGVVESRGALSHPESKASLNEIDQLLQKGAFLEAKMHYQKLIGQNPSAEDLKSIRRALEDLNMKILFSPIITSDSFLYTVQPGDSLHKIAKKHTTTIELIKKSNHLSSDTIQSGMKLKISKAVYSITIDKSENKLILYSDKELLKTYRVATGREGHRTPIGSFTVVNKLTNPTWYKAGAVVPPGSPDNILGTRWLGFSLESYGIHGTTLPETIGTDASEGCVRMLNQDVEELYAVIPIDTTVTIVD
ncbi:MAG: L,D-transpeptidase family protein [Candidatus Omnitrophica bacterium]|nr:L,D-transpeptidase family protein [Candidatus Omnitrophota bacterium]